MVELFDSNLKNGEKKLKSELNALKKKEFACLPDAQSAITEFEKKHGNKLFSVHIATQEKKTTHKPKGRPPNNPKPPSVTTSWKILADPITRNEDIIESKRQKHESFCLITNISPEVKSAHGILQTYKGQNNVENNFSVLKQEILASTLFLEKPERIEALMTLLYCSVLMHALLQLISRINIAKCPKPPCIGPEDRQLIRPKSDTMLNILESFKIVSIDGDYNFKSQIEKF
jgi:transposase